jgi:hypothetical protein
MALSYAFDTSQGETPDTVARRRQTADMLAARIFSQTPQNVGQGLNLIGQALIARQMQNEADAAQKAGQATAMTPQQLASLSMPAGQPLDLSPSAPSNLTVPNDSNAIPGTVGMNQALADRTQDFIQDNPGTSMTSGVRSTADQAALYADRGNNPNPVAPPGTSLHEKGLAVDIGGMTPDQRAQLPQYGLSQPVVNDPVHVQLAQGGPSPSPSARSSTYGGPFPGASNQVLLAQASNPWSAKELRAAMLNEINRRAIMDQQASDPERQLRMKYTQSLIDKNSRDDEGVFGTPIYGVGADGKPALGVIDKGGKFRQLDTGGVQVTPGVTWQDFGTYRQAYDKAGNPIGAPQPKNLQGAAQQTALGKAQGGMQATLPTDLQNAQSTIDQIDQLLKHPGLDSIVGSFDQFRPNWTLGSEGKDALARFNQLKGKAFLQAYSTLRGGGAITEVEGQKAQDAMARLDRAQSEPEFRQALQDFREAVQVGAAKLQQKAGVSALPTPAAGNSAPADPLGLR